jgi:hypothetical protein
MRAQVTNACSQRVTRASHVTINTNREGRPQPDLSGGMHPRKPAGSAKRTQPYSANGYLCHVRFLCRLDFKRLRRLCFDILRRRFFFKLPI